MKRRPMKIVVSSLRVANDFRLIPASILGAFSVLGSMLLSCFYIYLSTFQLSATDQLTCHFCFPEADEWHPGEAYNE
jgi:hypothetical protein